MNKEKVAQLVNPLIFLLFVAVSYKTESEFTEHGRKRGKSITKESRREKY